MGYGLCAPARKYCALLTTTAHIKYDKMPPATIAPILMTRIVAGILIFSNEMLSAENAPAAFAGRQTHSRR
jgi:hypothetical protein